MKTEVGMRLKNIFSNLRVKSKPPRQPSTAGPKEASSTQPAKLMAARYVLLEGPGKLAQGAVETQYDVIGFEQQVRVADRCATYLLDSVSRKMWDSTQVLMHMCLLGFHIWASHIPNSEGCCAYLQACRSRKSRHSFSQRRYPHSVTKMSRVSLSGNDVRCELRHNAYCGALICCVHTQIP